MNWSIFIASLSGVAIEFLEIVAIAYAIARSGYLREAITGSLAGLIGVGMLSAIPGRSLQLIPLQWLQLAIGAILVWLGFGWIKKSVKRQVNHQRAGWIGEDVLISEGIELVENEQGFSWLNFVVMTKSAALETLEVAIIVVTLGLASNAWAEALIGTALALLLSLLLATMLHPYLVKLPEVLIKLGAGIVICSLGTFWVCEGMSLKLPLGEFTILALIGLYAIASALVIYTLGIRKTKSISTSNQDY
jgi:uncharacterized membrane protein